MAPRKKIFRIPRHRKKEKLFKLVEENSDNDGDEEEIIEIDENENGSPQVQPIIIYPPPQQPLPQQPAAAPEILPNQPVPRPPQPNQPPVRVQTPAPPPPILIQPTIIIQTPAPIPIQPPVKIQTPAPRIETTIKRIIPTPAPAPPIPNPLAPPQPMPPIQPMIVQIPQPYPGMFPAPFPWQYPPYPPYPPLQPPNYPATRRPQKPKPRTTKPQNRPKPPPRTTPPPVGRGVFETTTVVRNRPQPRPRKPNVVGNVIPFNSNIGTGIGSLIPLRNVSPNIPAPRPDTPLPQTPPPRIFSSTAGVPPIGEGVDIGNTTTESTTITPPTVTPIPISRGVSDDDYYSATSQGYIEPQKLSADNSDTDCCISITAGWLTVGIFMFLSILILIACLYCMCYFRKKEKRKCKDAIKQYNDNYHQTSKIPNFDSHYMPPGPAIMTPQAKMDLLMKNMKDDPHPITTDERSMAGVLNYLADNPIEHDVIYRPGRNDVVLSQKEIPPHLRSIPSSEFGSEPGGLKLPESSQLTARETNIKSAPKVASRKEKEKSGKNENSWSKKGSKSIEKIKEKLFNRSKSNKKAKKSSSAAPKKEEEKERIEEAPKNDAISPNPRRSKDRVVFHEGKHHRL